MRARRGTRGRGAAGSGESWHGYDAPVTPAWWKFSATLAWCSGKAEIRAQVIDLLNTSLYAGCYTDGTMRHFFPIATRNVLLMTRFYS